MTHTNTEEPQPRGQASRVMGASAGADRKPLESWPRSHNHNRTSAVHNFSNSGFQRPVRGSAPFILSFSSSYCMPCSLLILQSSPQLSAPQRPSVIFKPQPSTLWFDMRGDLKCTLPPSDSFPGSPRWLLSCSPTALASPGSRQLPCSLSRPKHCRPRSVYSVHDAAQLSSVPMSTPLALSPKLSMFSGITRSVSDAISGSMH